MASCMYWSIEYFMEYYMECSVEWSMEYSMSPNYTSQNSEARYIAHPLSPIPYCQIFVICSRNTAGSEKM